MAKKAKLDILEIAPEKPSKETPPDEVASENGSGEGSPAEQAGGDFRTTIMGWVRKPRLWIILLSVMFLGVTTGILVNFYKGTDEPLPVAQKWPAVPGAALPEAKQGALFEGMVVDQKDEKGNIRIVFCDVALELGSQKTAGAINGDRVDVRIVIYEILKKEPAQEGLSPEGRGRLKGKLKKELNGLFGEDLVKEVYFTRYELD